MEALDTFLKICYNEANWRLVLIIYGIPLCGIDVAHVPLLLVGDTFYHVTMLSCYHVVHLSIIFIMIQMQLRSNNFE